jgi:hypothetical protein
MNQHDLAQILAQLQAPFPPELHAFKPGRTTQDKSRGLAMAYVDPRHYQARLDAVDPAWHDAYETLLLGDRVFVVCRLTIAGVTRSDVGEHALTLETRRGECMAENAFTSAVAQAFKRAAAKFGLGRYLYTDVPKSWAELDPRTRRFSDATVQRLRQQVARITGQPPTGPQRPAAPAPEQHHPAGLHPPTGHPPPAGGNGGGMTLAQARSLVLTCTPKSKPAYRGQTLAALEAADPAFITWAAQYAPGDVRQAAGLIVAAR